MMLFRIAVFVPSSVRIGTAVVFGRVAVKGAVVRHQGFGCVNRAVVRLGLFAYFGGIY